MFPLLSLIGLWYDDNISLDVIVQSCWLEGGYHIRGFDVFASILYHVCGKRWILQWFFNCWLVVVPCVFLYIITLYESIFPCCGDNMHSLYFYFGDPLAEVHTHTIQDDLNIGRLGMWSMPDGEYNVSSDEFLDSCNIPDVTQMDSWRYHLVFVTVSWPPVAINSPEKRSGFFCASFIVS